MRAVTVVGALGIVAFAAATLALTHRVVPVEVGLALIGSALAAYGGALVVGVVIVRWRDGRRGRGAWDAEVVVRSTARATKGPIDSREFRRSPSSRRSARISTWVRTDVRIG